MRKSSRPSVMKHTFSEVPSVNIPRSTFDRSHGLKTTFDGGYLIPIFVDEALPGDTMSLRMHGFARLATQKYPIMDNMRMETFFFAVPIRLIWANWKRFCGERPTPGASIDFTVPKVTYTNAANQTIVDYFGLPTRVNAAISVSALPFRAYNLIWNEWFRDQNLQEPLTVYTSDGPDNMTGYAIRQRGKRHDYFTSSLPWLQKGDAVTLPINLYKDVEVKWRRTTGPNSPALETFTSAYITGAGKQIEQFKITNGTLQADTYSGYPFFNINENFTFSVNHMRQSFQVQRILERDARSGSRYTEIVQSHFGVQSPDARMQRPEYLGGGSTPVNITPIAQTDTAVGRLAGIGVSSFSGHGFTKSFTEHCILIGLVNVRADLTYQQGIEKMWLRNTRYDFYWPTLAHLGEQAVLNKEIYIDATTIGNGVAEQVFGYQERYAEYRYKPSRITGQMRSNDQTPLDAWHLSQRFMNQPTLGPAFIVDDPPIDRVILTPSEPHFIFDSYFDYRCARPMPVYSVPGYVDHF